MSNIIIEQFLSAYFYLLEVYHNTITTELYQLEFESEEANTDRALKEYFKEFILSHSDIKSLGSISSVSIQRDKEEYRANLSDIEDVFIEQVIIPNEITDNLKDSLKLDDRIYTKPDLILILCSRKTNIKSSPITIELKSTKNDKIPGSSVQQIKPFEWVIFVKHSRSKAKVVTGYYINSITNKLPFPDRSPRPQVGFNTLIKWNKKSRFFSKNTGLLEVIYDSKELEIKRNILESWEDVLVSEWIDTIFYRKKQKKEKWFNNTLRKFSLKFIYQINELSDQEIRKLENKIKQEIEK